MNNEVYEGVDVYTKDYDYEDVKVAICVAEFVSERTLYFDFETVIKIAIRIREEWEKQQETGLLTEEEYAYIQAFAVNYLNANKDEIMEELA